MQIDLRPLALLALLPTVAAAQAPAQQSPPARSGPVGTAFFMRPDVGIARAADSNVDDEVTGPEWSALLAELADEAADAADPGTPLDRRRVKALLLRPDLDGDGVLSARDVESTLRGTATDQGFSGGLLGVLARALADSDDDGQLTEEERQALLRELGPDRERPLDTNILVDWMLRSESLPPPVNRDALTPIVVFTGLQATLDADSNGKITVSDLQALFAGLDTNGDGELDTGELNPAPVTRRPGAHEWVITDEARARPPAMPWQRNLDDALALVKSTGKPLLICVNMDGETASEVLAWDRYRDPEFAALAAGFVPVLASPDRRNPRERDDRGRRLPDGRFGRLVNSEHIDIEPELFERFFDGRRVAPRHIGISPEGEILFDVFLVQDLSIIDEKLRAFGATNAAEVCDPVTLSEEELFASPDAAHRDELEARFVAGDERTRLRLAALALSEVRATQHPELVRLALRDPEPSVRRQGVWAVLQHAEKAPIDAFPDAFTALAGEDALRDALVDATRRVVRAAKGSARGDAAAFHLRVFSRLEEESELVDSERWGLALAAAYPVVEAEPGEVDLDATSELLDALDAALERRPGDVELLVRQAGANIRLARILISTGQNPTFLFQDAIRSSRSALDVAPADGRALGYHAWASYMLSDTEKATELVERAVPRLVRDAGSPLATQVLSLFASLRTQAIYDAVGAGDELPAEAIPDARAAHELLAATATGTPERWRAYLDLLGTLRANGAQAETLRRALRQHPTSGDLHAYLRFQVLRDEGARALEAVYAGELFADVAPAERPLMDWYHGLASLVAAEQDVANHDAVSAVAAYERCGEHFTRASEASPGYAASASHYSSLALAGIARLQTDASEYERAVESVVRAVSVAPASVESTDGLGRTTIETARELLRALQQSEHVDLAHDLEARLTEAGLDLVVDVAVDTES